MKYLFVLLFPLLIKGQYKVNNRLVIPNDAMHFYGAVAASEMGYGIQTLLFKEQKESWKLFNTWLFTQMCIFGKEIFDKYKKNPTGFDLQYDVPPGELGSHSWLFCKISINDIRNNRNSAKPRKVNNKKYILD